MSAAIQQTQKIVILSIQFADRASAQQTTKRQRQRKSKKLKESKLILRVVCQLQGDSNRGEGVRKRALSNRRRTIARKRRAG